MYTFFQRDTKNYTRRLTLWREIIREKTVLSYHYSTNLKVASSILIEVIGLFFNRPNPYGFTMALMSTQPLTEISNRHLPVGKGRPACKADLTSICEPTL
jgi:hypothetical protein